MTTRRTLPAHRLPSTLAALKPLTVATLTHIDGFPYFDPFVITGTDMTLRSVYLEREGGVDLVINRSSTVGIRLDTVKREGV